MVQVKVRFYASLRDYIGVGEVIVHLNERTFNMFRDNLKALLGEKADRIFSEDGTLRRGLIVSINNTIIHPSNLQELKLCENDVVDFMPAPSGG
jgi:molybdopterin converting factor small subunit